MRPQDFQSTAAAWVRSRIMRLIAGLRFDSPVILLDRYIARQVVGGTLVALMALVALFTFIDFVHDLNNVGKGDYNMART